MSTRMREEIRLLRRSQQRGKPLRIALSVPGIAQNDQR